MENQIHSFPIFQLFKKLKKKLFSHKNVAHNLFTNQNYLITLVLSKTMKIQKKKMNVWLMIRNIDSNHGKERSATQKHAITLS